MFESTIEAQSLNDSEGKLGMLSAAVLAHLGVGVAILAVTAIVVPTVQGPPLPPPVVFIVTPPHLDDLAARDLRPPAPKRGTPRVQPGRTEAPSRPEPVEPPVTTPEKLPDPASETAPEGPAGPGDGTLGDPNGSGNGMTGGTGDGSGEPGGDGTASPVELTGDMVRPVLLVKVDPIYPIVARRAGIGGRVSLRAIVSLDGSVEAVEIISSTNPLFNDAAADAVRKRRYRPALMNGRPVRVYFTVTVDFLVR